MADKNWLNELERLNRIDREDFQTAEVPFEESAMGKLLAELEKQSAQEDQRRAAQDAAEAQRRAERMEDQADGERRYRTQNKLTIITSAIFFILGALLDHWSGAVAWFLSLFH